MLIVQEHLVKLGGVKLSGQMKSIDISETASIEDVQDKKGKTKANQPTGYEAAQISIEFTLEETKGQTVQQQIKAMQRLFKSSGQKKAKLLRIYNTECAARGISKVYFNKLQSKKNVNESWTTVTLELVAPVIAGIKLKKKSSSSKKKKSSKKSKSKKSKSKSPAKKKKSSTAAKKAAKKLVKSGGVKV